MMSENDNVPTLGRVLFYDRQLSVNNSVSCSSCHKQNLAFADNVAFSTGFENRLTARNSMPIQNLGSFFGEALFWDGREQMLTSMVLRPVVNHVEMGITDLDALAAKLSNVPYYRDLFLNAYGSETVTREKIADALANFLTQIRSTNTRLDMGQLNALEISGQQLFTSKYDCNSCHQVESPHGYIMAGTFANIGLDPVYTDDGLQRVSNSSTDAGKFKIPSLRNVALTAPYMHDGRFNTLEEVIDHYSTGITAHPNLDPRLRQPDGAPVAFNISESEKKAIVAFLNSLTDYTMISDPKLSNPFKSR
jgi:cytochrome c peroxidase